jgi:hypothetical protein
MDASSIGKQLLQAVLFGLVVWGGYLLISDSQLWWRRWLGGSWVLAWLAWIILFGLIKI